MSFTSSFQLTKEFEKPLGGQQLPYDTKGILNVYTVMWLNKISSKKENVTLRSENVFKYDNEIAVEISFQKTESDNLQLAFPWLALN